MKPLFKMCWGWCNWKTLVSSLATEISETPTKLQSYPYTFDGSFHLRVYIISAPTIGVDPINANTEAPSEQDKYITWIENSDLPLLRQQLQ